MIPIQPAAIPMMMTIGQNPILRGLRRQERRR